MRNRLISVLFAAACLCACNDKDQITPSQVLGGNALSSGTVVFSPTGSDYYVSFTTENAWTLVGEIPEWLTVSKTSGRPGTANVKFSAPINDTETDREVSLTFDVGKGAENPVILIQQPFPYLKVTNLDYAFTWNQSDVNETEPFKVMIESNIKWGFTHIEGNGSSWFNLSEIEGTDNAIVTINPKNVNIGKEKYISQWRIVPYKVDEDGNEEEISEVVDDYFVNVDQANLRFLVNDSVEDFSMDITQLNAATADVIIDCEQDWVVESKPDWVKTSIAKADSGITAINLTADGVSPLATPREGVVVLKCKAGAQRTLKVTQEGYVFTVSSSAFNFEEGLFLGNNDLTSREITLTTAGAWELKNIPDWLEVTPTSSVETYDTPTPVTIQVKAKEQNLRLEHENPIEKMCFTRTVKPYGVQEDPLDKNLNLRQDPFVFEVNPASMLSRIPTMSTDQYDVHVVSSGKWYVEQSYPDWLALSDTGSEAAELTMKVGAKTANGDLTSDRSCVVTLVSQLHEEKGIALKRDFNVLQSKFIFELTKSSFSYKPYAFASQPSTFVVKASTDWTIAEKPDWISVSKTGGDGTTDVEVKITPTSNSAMSDRSGTIKITNSYTSHELKVDVSQDAFAFDQTDYNWKDIEVMNEQTATVSFDFSEAAEWVVESGYPSWMNPASTSGKGGSDNKSSIKLKPQANPNLVTREGELYIKSKDGNYRKKIAFTQKPFEFDNTLVKYEFTTFAGGTKSLDVLCSGPWTVTGNDWVTISPVNGSSSGIVTVTVFDNLGFEGRTVELKLTSTLNDLVRKIKINQGRFYFDSTPVNMEFEALDEKVENVDIVCSGAWSVEGKADWINMSKTSGTGNPDGTKETVTISLTNNPTEYERSAELKFVSQNNKNYVKVVKIKQAGYVLDVNLTQVSYDAQDTSVKTIEVTSTSSWTAKSDSSWLTVADGTGTGNGSFTIQPSENTSTDERRAVVTVSNTHNSITKQIVVIQAAAPAPEPEPEPEQPATR